MRDAKRIDTVVRTIEAYWRAHPDLRLGQLIENMRAASPSNASTYFIEDEELMQGLMVLRALS